MAHLTIPDDLHRRLKVLATSQGRSLRAFVTDLLMQSLATLAADWTRQQQTASNHLRETPP